MSQTKCSIAIKISQKVAYVLNYMETGTNYRN